MHDYQLQGYVHVSVHHVYLSGFYIVRGDCIHLFIVRWGTCTCTFSSQNTRHSVYIPNIGASWSKQWK